MACLKFKKFCFCLDLRRGCFIIAFVTLVLEVIFLIITSFVAKNITDVYNENKNSKKNIDGIIYAYKFLTFLHMLLICLKLLLSIALLVGLFKRLPDHLEMWYKGYLLSIFVQAAIMVCAAVKSDTAELYWLVTVRFVITIVTVYFIIMVRSYYFQMCKEVNYYQNIIYTQTSVKGHMSFSDRPIKNREDSIYETIPSQKNVVKPDTEPPKYGFLKKAGGEVYSTPKSAELVMPMTVLSEANDKQSSMLYPSLV